MSLLSDHTFSFGCCSLGAASMCAFVVVFNYFCICAVIVGPWLWLTSIFGMFKFLGVSLSLGMVLWNLFRATTTDPGAVPPGWVPPNATSFELEEAKLRKETIRRNFKEQFVYCHRCDQFKPPRCHHCRTCQRCVLKMDHHCPWISNCVGVHNQKYYLLFLIYGFLGCIYVLFLYVWWSIDIAWGNREAEEEIVSGGLVVKSVLVASNALISGIALILLSILLAKQLRLVSRNTTTIEVWEKIWAQQDCEKKGLIYNHIWDLESELGNFKQVLGENIWLWPFPTGAETDGLSFPTNGLPQVRKKPGFSVSAHDTEMAEFVGEAGDNRSNDVESPP